MKTRGFVFIAQKAFNKKEIYENLYFCKNIFNMSDLLEVIYLHLMQNTCKKTLFGKNGNFFPTVCLEC